MEREDYTTISIDRPVFNWIKSIQGGMEFLEAENKTMTDTLLSMCIYTEFFLAIRMKQLSFKDVYENPEKFNKIIEKRMTHIINDERMTQRISEKFRELNLQNED